jgi:hypothetical protein
VCRLPAHVYSCSGEYKIRHPQEYLWRNLIGEQTKMQQRTNESCRCCACSVNIVCFWSISAPSISAENVALGLIFEKREPISFRGFKYPYFEGTRIDMDQIFGGAEYQSISIGFPQNMGNISEALDTFDNAGNHNVLSFMFSGKTRTLVSLCMHIHFTLLT